MFRGRTVGREREGLRWIREEKARENRGIGDKRGQSCVNRLLLSTIVWSCPVLDQHSLSGILLCSISNCFPEERGTLSVCMCAWRFKCQQLELDHGSEGPVCLRCQQTGECRGVCVLHACICQCGITTKSQAGVASKSDEWLECRVSMWPKVWAR